MARANHIKALIKSHFDNEGDRFVTLALQVAAHEAKMGHVHLAEEIRKLVDKSKSSARVIRPLPSVLEGLVLEVQPKHRLSELVSSSLMQERIERILTEFRQKNKLRSHGLENRRKILLTGPPGTGKTMTASIIAKELHLPLFVVLMEKMITKYMGETSAKLRLVFDLIRDKKAVYLFDEFDAIGTDRSSENDVGEMRRVLNSFLQFIERDNSESIVIAATNNKKMLDQALFRRFDDILQYELPNRQEILELIENKLLSFKSTFELENILPYAKGLSHSEITQACLDLAKDTILNNKKEIKESILIKFLKEKQASYNRTMH